VRKTQALIDLNLAQAELDYHMGNSLGANKYSVEEGDFGDAYGDTLERDYPLNLVPENKEVIGK